MPENNTGEIVSLALFRKQRDAAANNGVGTTACEEPATTIAQPPVKQPEGTIPVNTEITHEHLVELSETIKYGIRMLKRFEIAVDGCIQTQMELDAAIARFSRDCPSPLDTYSLAGPKVLLTPKLVAQKDKLMADLEKLATRLCESVAVAGKRKRLQRAVEFLADVLQPGKLKIAKGKRANLHLQQAAVYLEDLIEHLDNCGSLLAASGLSISQGRLQDARGDLKKVDNLVTILRAAHDAVQGGQLVANS